MLFRTLFIVGSWLLDLFVVLSHSNHDKDLELLILRDQIAILRRIVKRPKFSRFKKLLRPLQGAASLCTLQRRSQADEGTPGVAARLAQRRRPGCWRQANPDHPADHARHQPRVALCTQLQQPCCAHPTPPHEPPGDGGHVGIALRHGRRPRTRLLFCSQWRLSSSPGTRLLLAHR